MSRTNVMVAFGTRPEAIKMAPIVRELQQHADRIRTLVVVTAQHREMLDQVLQLFELQPDYDLNLMTAGQTLSDVTCGVLRGVDSVFDREAVDLVLVQGDTTTTFATALAAYYHKVAVGHVEAGLRTYNKFFPFPEEMNRVLTTRLSDMHFAPTETSKDNLIREGIPEDRVLVTGNTVIDALLSIVGPSQGKRVNHPGRRRILVTAHRRESFGEPLERICQALLDVVGEHVDVEVVFPVHLNPNVRRTVFGMLSGHERIHLTEPLAYQEFAEEIARSYLILTDSGGIQEEAPALGKPVLVLRTETEREEGVSAGTCRLVGSDREQIVTCVRSLLVDRAAYEAMSRAVNPYGDGRASQRIVRWIINEFHP
ncbi:MAG: UDP-N-acetylglucosamine 2-epimerase (non-hydrolyzing) [Planctomycetaceae bacterium]|nr:UDP-N-acetylglucosamine 2-epimerase (non-hydrolyzing) [Planctomycetaceae bacterium]